MKDLSNIPESGARQESEGSGEEYGKILAEKKLANGMEFVLYDRSRRLVGDRWHLEILCRAHLPCDESYWEMTADHDPGQRSAIRRVLGEKLLFSSSKKRTFVEASEKETVLREMVQQVYDSFLEYLNRPDFPRRLFQKQYREARQKVLLSEAMKLAQRSAADE